eukprot:COSAG01_NODE_2146_length_8303_cov_24.698684_4_plen_126_part_00
MSLGLGVAWLGLCRAAMTITCADPGLCVAVSPTTAGHTDCRGPIRRVHALTMVRGGTYGYERPGVERVPLSTLDCHAQASDGPACHVIACVLPVRCLNRDVHTACTLLASAGSVAIATGAIGVGS